ncbi:DNA ligase 1-like isoform X2 [Eriocheir sinensis]|nr:DNA ligase 1-like isoform X2 [Eriocheir sinensis]
MDTMLITVNENSPSETSSGKETEATTRKTSKKEKKKAQGRKQSTRTHTGSNMEANTQVEQTVSKITNIQKRKKVGQTAKKTNNKEKEKKAIEKQQTVDKKARSSTRTESSLHHKAMQQSESTVEHPTVKKMGQNNSRKREHISNAVKSSKRQRNESSVPAKASVATHLAIDAMLSPGQNSGIVPSSEGNVLKRLHVDPDAGTDKVTGQFMQHEPPNTGESPNQPKKACDLEVSDRSLSSDGSESESQYEDGSLTDSDEDDMISEFSATQKKKSSLHQTRERLKRRNYRPKHRESVSKVIFDNDNDILIMEPPKPVPMSENKKDNTNSENSQSTKGVQGRPFMESPYVSLKTQRANRRAAGGHQQSLTTSSSFIQGLIKNSIMKNVPEMMTSASTRVPVDGQTEEEPDPEDMWDLLPALPQQSSSSLAARAAKTSLQESGITETAATAPERPTTVTSTNISGAVITSKASKVMRSFWIESEEEEEDKDTEDTESLFMPTLPVASQLIQESTVLPSYSSLGPEHWMSVARAMQKRKKNSFLRLTFL